MGAQLRFEIRPSDAGFECGELRDRIQRKKAAQPRHSDREGWPLSVSGRQMANDAGRAADRNRDGAHRHRPAERLTDLVFALRKGDPVDDRADMSKTKPKPVLKALADARPQPRFRVPADEAMVREARRRDLGDDRIERGVNRL